MRNPYDGTRPGVTGMPPTTPGPVTRQREVRRTKEQRVIAAARAKVGELQMVPWYRRSQADTDMIAAVDALDQ